MKTVKLNNYQIKWLSNYYSQIYNLAFTNAIPEHWNNVYDVNEKKMQWFANLNIFQIKQTSNVLTEKVYFFLNINTPWIWWQQHILKSVGQGQQKAGKVSGT